MSRHWNPRELHGGRSRSGFRPRGRIGLRLSAGEIRLMVLGGILMGLVAVDLPGGWSGGGSAPEAEHWAGPVRVIDGDTFVHRGMRVRIADIDTPEVRGACASERRLAAEAAARMRTLLAAGPFELHPLPGGRDEDRYGRKLRIVTRDGRSLGDQLVGEGLARSWTGRRRPWC